MEKLLAVALGGGTGAVLRYLVYLFYDKHTDHSFPWATLTVNLAGSFVIGLLWGLFDKVYVSPGVRLFIFVGILGSFTTFSTFAFDFFNLARSQPLHHSLIYAVVTNVAGFTLAAGGYYLTRIF